MNWVIIDSCNGLSPLMCHVKSLRLGDVYMCLWTGSSLIHVMACHLFGTKPLPEPMMAYRQLDLWEQYSVNFLSKLNYFHWQNCIWKCRLQRRGGGILSLPQCINTFMMIHIGCPCANVYNVSIWFHDHFYQNISSEKCLIQITCHNYGNNICDGKLVTETPLVIGNYNENYPI